jgi:Mg-chelatase subunit ChlI
MISLLSACTHYYKVSDPSGDREYYTKSADATRNGTIKLKDAITLVTLQSSDVKEISEAEFEAAVHGEQAKPR